MAITLRPSILVVLRTTVTGGVTYDRTDLDTGEAPMPGVSRRRWVTDCTIMDPEEHERAGKVRSAARSLFTRICVDAPLGLMLPLTITEEGEDADIARAQAQVDVVEAEARALIATHNDIAKHTHITLESSTFTFSSPAQAARNERALRTEIARLMDLMEVGISKADPKVIQGAADRARELAQILGEEAKGVATAAIEQARKARSAILKRIIKEGEDAQTVVMGISRGMIASARTAFLDFDDAPVTAEAPMGAQRSLDLSAVEVGEVAPEVVPDIAPAVEAAPTVTPEERDEGITLADWRPRFPNTGTV